MKKTLIPGASPNPARFSNKMVKSLLENGYEPIPLGLRKGDISGIEILTGKPGITDLHTISLYLGASRQIDYYDYFLSLKPKRIIFNPGTYNYELIELAEKNNIECVVNCALIMLSNGKY
ncbi:MAG: CoA-binding protein [Bacteroidales bacterium]|nr:CoA-binding protein [Bacteroidales bacterium]